MFGTANALQYLFQATGWNLPYEIFLALPYLLTLYSSASVTRRVSPPVNLGKWIKAK
jgi:Uncharacterized ABC-type transport system, permease component